MVTPETFDNCCLNVFCDASKDAYSAVACLVLHGECNDVFLLFSRLRLTPLKGATIPRFELLAAALGVVLIGSDNRKRIDWPPGVITEFIPGKDKQVRLIKVKTSHCTLLRLIQRIYPLEVDSSKDLSNPFTDLEEQRRGDNAPNPCDLKDIS
ncbi:hypothetical protein CEXT_251811 [Caerostris extrusa]|uniref:DUF5641 domain-containing protein n=1 Tax=Caerostris extrusa TaxID=172846 RepID=A0AAV4XD84_CAEEX|nr:hypothetical protein CEXT_251811 [Caerostris extrusa]